MKRLKDETLSIRASAGSKQLLRIAAGCGHRSFTQNRQRALERLIPQAQLVPSGAVSYIAGRAKHLSLILSERLIQARPGFSHQGMVLPQSEQLSHAGS